MGDEPSGRADILAGLARAPGGMPGAFVVDERTRRRTRINHEHELSARAYSERNADRYAARAQRERGERAVGAVLLRRPVVHDHQDRLAVYGHYPNSLLGPSAGSSLRGWLSLACPSCSLRFSASSPSA